MTLQAPTAEGPRPAELLRVSIELTNACSKACPFCYNHSLPGGATLWTPDEVVAFVLDCADHGVRAVSFGGGEPLQYPGVYEVLERTRGRLFRSLTSNGLLLAEHLDRLVAAGPDKIHLSIHEPGRAREVDRVVAQVLRLRSRGIDAGVNLLVRRSGFEAARLARLQLTEAGIGPDRTMFLPMRGSDTPTPAELARVAGTSRFQSMTCLLGCGASPRFVSVGWDRQVAWCSYTSSRRPLPTLDFQGILDALGTTGLEFCGPKGTNAEASGRPPA